MFTAIQDITIQKIDFPWIAQATKISHLKRAIKVIEMDGDYFPELKEACFKRIQQIDPTQKRIKVSNNIDHESKKQLENQLLEWESVLVSKEATQKKSNVSDDGLKDYESYFDNQNEADDQSRKAKMAEAERIKGNEAIKSKDFQEALTYYTTSISLDSKAHQTYGNRALAFLKTKQYDKCIQDCEQCLKLNSSYIKAYHRKAKALLGKGEKVSAYRCLQEGQKIEPENGDLTKELKELRQELKPEQIKQLDSGLIPQSEFRKITIQQDSQEDD